MEPIHTHLHAILPLAEEMLDTTNRCIRRVVHFNVFYDEAQVDPEAIAGSLIGVEEAIAFPGEEEHIYRYDDVVFTSAHRCRIHLSRPVQDSGVA